MTEVISMQKVKVRGQSSRSQRSKPTLVVSVLWLQFEFTGGYEMMHKAWSCIEEVSHCFSRSSVKFQGHTGQKSRRFWPKFGVSGLQFELIDGYEMKHKAWCSWEDVPYCFSRSSVKFWGHRGQKITNFDPNWTFPDCNSSLNSPMALKWCTELDMV